MASGAYVREGEPAVHEVGSRDQSGDCGTPSCCPLYHRAVELIGRRWTGAIIEILIQGGSLRFSQIASAVTDLSDRMLSDRLKELEAWDLVQRTVHPGPPVRVEYALTPKGRELTPALAELKQWARAWLDGHDGARPAPSGAGSPAPAPTRLVERL
ncbi:MAG TPA: helix-turn-helix domain-containing protein [Solirubrobacteraceae bacterium]|nr:helix-turn-helix domain-containing protein [Solirubrobacteraceae bacterium]